MCGLGGRAESGDQARRAGQGSAGAAGDSGVCVPGAGAARLVLGVSAGGELGGAPRLPRSGLSMPREIPRGPARLRWWGATWPGVVESEQLIKRIPAGGGSVTYQRGFTRNLPAKQVM